VPFDVFCIQARSYDQDVAILVLGDDALVSASGRWSGMLAVVGRTVLSRGSLASIALDYVS